MVNIEIDGKPIQAEEGSMVIQAADAAGIYIPRFCYHKKLSVAANCRMCLVEVEKVRKPLPACATPVSEGMKVFTRSPKAISAQKGTMEFLLINHPLDCPICDQGGECDLQDLAVGYGGDASHYHETKRVVPDKNLGPLIATEMTRCIHCTRCVRFGRELAGQMELGATGRGEHMRIGTYVESSVNSELSGNMIDLCPVGALTSKPFRFTIRTWELQDSASISPHDVVGSNLYLQVHGNEVHRALPRENEAVNEIWLSDRDRFSYTGLHVSQRLTRPLVRENGRWRETDWNSALEFAANGLKRVINESGSGSLGALASPTATVEEMFLLQKLMRGLGSHNVDHRLRQLDFSADDVAPAFPALGRSIGELEHLKAALLIGSNIRKEQPLLGLRLRKAFLAGAQIMAVNPVDYAFTFGLGTKAIVSPRQMPATLARIACALAKTAGKSLPAEVKKLADGKNGNDADTAIAQALYEAGGDGAVILGNVALSHAHYAALYALAETVADLSGASLGVLAEANSAGGWLAGCVPHREAGGAGVATPGLNAARMLEGDLRGLVLVGTEPELDGVYGSARKALDAARFVVTVSAFRSSADEYADVQLPAAPFSETSGTFVNCEGRVQSFTGAVAPQGEARPGWKILRVLGNLMDVAGFDYTSSAEVRDAADLGRINTSTRMATWRLAEMPASETASEIDLERIVEVPPYAVDPLVRRAPPLLQTADNPGPAVHMNQDQAATLGLADSGGGTVHVHIGQAIAKLPLVIDARVPDGCILVPAGYPETSVLDGRGLARVVRG